MKTILIIGQTKSLEVQSLQSQAKKLGINTYFIDAAYMGKTLDLEYYPHNDKSILVIYAQGKTKLVPLDSISGVYCAKINPPTGSDRRQQMEYSCLFQLLLSQQNLNWVNSAKAIQFHRTKPKQLHLAKRLGANIPATYIGCQQDAIESFMNTHSEIIVKPVFAGHLSFKPTALQKQSKLIKTWANQAITLQNYIEGQDVRTYVVGDFIVSAIIKSQKKESTNTITNEFEISDYRELPNAEMIPMQLPIHVQQLAIRIMRAFHLQFTAIDWRLRPNGEFVFLEANPAPLFVYAQNQLGVEIDKALINLLIK